jgi:activator of 2-hydroxyglutaryl-CoA dehydratase
MIRGRLFALSIVGLFATAAPLLAAHAAEASMPGDLQGMKGELLNLNRDISQLESQLLFPSTETSVVVAVDPGSGVKLVDVNLLLDDKNVGYHYYSQQEYEALLKGGMQRIFTGNVTSGQHTLKATITGYDPNGKDFQRTATYTFTKGAQRKVIELKASDNAARTESEFRFREWEIQ